MKKTVYLSDFRDAFKAAGRGEQFSYEGLGLIFDYLEEYERESGEEIELDVIAICCEWAEETAENITQNYDVDCEGMDEDEINQAVMDYLCDNTTVLEQTGSGTFIYMQF